MSQETKVTRSRCQRWIEDGGKIRDGFVEVEDVLDGNVALSIADDNVDTVQLVWLEPENARRAAHALIDAADAIEARGDCDGD